VKKSELEESLLKDYLYEEYFIKKFKELLTKRLKPETKNILGIVLQESKGHSAMLKELMKQLKIDLDVQTTNSTAWLLQSLMIKKNSSKRLNEFLNALLVEEVDLRRIYENQVKRIDDKRICETLNKIIKEEYEHEAKIRGLLAKT
jgi:rubrerythrin